MANFQQLAEQKPSTDRSKICRTDYGGEPPRRPNFIMIGDSTPYTWVKLSTGGVILCFHGQALSRPRALESHITSINAISAKNVSLKSLVDTSRRMGQLSSKTPHFRDVNGDFQLDFLRAYLGAEETDPNA
jgi:hypothetical protein